MNGIIREVIFGIVKYDFKWYGRVFCVCVFGCDFKEFFYGDFFWIGFGGIVFLGGQS